MVRDNLSGFAVISALITGCVGQPDDNSLLVQRTTSAIRADGDAGTDDAGTTAPPPIVRIANGLLRGKWSGPGRAFLGVPYAKPPLGTLRFAAPQPPDDWNDERDASVLGAPCPQGASPLAQTGASEDCLTLNVFVPSSGAARARLPVMVFLPGGAFVTGGSGTIDGMNLATAGPVIVVTVTYRLGPLGFLALPALDAVRLDGPSGSDGIRDQQAALRWVSENIAAFGGNPANVTLFGESAGSMSTCLHLVSPGSQGLFRRAIMQSGTCLSGGMAAKSQQASYALSQALADQFCPASDDKIACLRAQPSDALATWGAGHDIFGAGWGPTIEGDVIPDKPETLLSRTGRLAPFIIGINENEWSFFQLTGRDPRVTTLSELQAKLASLFGEQAALIAEQYPAASDDTANDTDVRLMTDIRLRCPTRTLLRLAAAAGRRGRAYSFEQGLAYHSQELGYVFGTAQTSDQSTDPLERFIESYWTTFASRGTPSADDAPVWPRYDAVSGGYLQLRDPPVALTGFADTCDFWEAFIRAGNVVNPL
jgi:para-nitrobenzyl esterase